MRKKWPQQGVLLYINRRCFEIDFSNDLLYSHNIYEIIVLLIPKFDLFMYIFMKMFLET